MLEQLRLVCGGTLIIKGIHEMHAANYWRDHEEKYWKEYDAPSSTALTALRLSPRNPSANRKPEYDRAVRRMRFGGIWTAVLGVVLVLSALSDLGILNIRR